MLTQGYDRSSGRTGPYAGALTSFPINFGTIVSSTTYTHAVKLPAGMAFYITDITSFCGTVGAAGVSLTVGTSAANGAEVVALVALTTGLQTHTLASNAVAAGGTIFLQLISGAATGTIVAPAAVTITGFVAAAPTSVGPRTVVGTGFAG